MRKTLVRGVAALGLLCPPARTAVPTDAPKQLTYGFVEANITIRHNPKLPWRLKAVSQVFGYCWTPTIEHDIVRNATDLFHAYVSRSYGDDYEVTYIYVHGAFDTEAAAAKAREWARTNRTIFKSYLLVDYAYVARYPTCT